MALFSLLFHFQSIFQALSVLGVADPVSLVHRLLHLGGMVEVNAFLLNNESIPFKGFFNT
jgi:hypothetical protein